MPMRRLTPVTIAVFIGTEAIKALVSHSDNVGSHHRTDDHKHILDEQRISEIRNLGDLNPEQALAARSCSRKCRAGVSPLSRTCSRKSWPSPLPRTRSSRRSADLRRSAYLGAGAAFGRRTPGQPAVADP